MTSIIAKCALFEQRVRLDALAHSIVSVLKAFRKCAPLAGFVEYLTAVSAPACLPFHAAGFECHTDIG